MAVNIDEGEPGTFKDRYYLERDPHRFLEGMLIAAWAVGIDDDLRLPARRIPRLPRDARARARGADGRSAVRRCRAIHLRRGAGAYICGEESAMIESIEGKRGMPRLRPPYVAQVGLFGRPTLEHNMETLYWVRDIVEKGAEWFAGARPQRPQGPALVLGVGPRRRSPACISRRPASRVRELIDEYCGGMLDGHTFYAYLPGGASGGILPASHGRHPARLRHAAAVRLLHRLGRGHRPVATTTRARDAARNLMQLLRRRIVRPVHAVPRRHRQGVAADGRSRRWDTAAARGPVAGDGATRRSAASARRRRTRSPASSSTSRTS